jgi:hypothetical protein
MALLTFMKRRFPKPRPIYLISVIALVVIVAALGAYYIEHRTTSNNYVPAAVLRDYKAYSGISYLDKCYKLKLGVDWGHPIYVIAPARANLVVTSEYYDSQGMLLGTQVVSDVPSEDKPAPVDVSKGYTCHHVKQPSTAELGDKA